MQIKHPLNFVVPDTHVWPELKGWDGSRLADQVLSDRSDDILDSWVIRTFYQLRLAGETQMTISNTTRRDAINFVGARQFGRKERDPLAFIVVPQGDAHHSELANFRIQQNGVRPERDDSATIWHWPQPGIIPRDAERGTRFDSLCYKGRILNLDEDFRSDAFLAAIRELGITFDVDGYNGERGEQNWNNYSQYDAVLAIRNLTVYDVSKKPASKLVNAWFAELPALLGPEPAYRELGTPGEDYIEVCNQGDILDALKVLRDNPERFASIVENGKRQRTRFTEEALTRMWLDTLSGPVSEHFERWQRTPIWTRLFRSISGMIQEPRSKAQDRRDYLDGERLLDAYRASQ